MPEDGAPGPSSRRRLRAWVRRLASVGEDENTLLLGLALAIGGASGLAAIAFYSLIDLSQAAALSAAAGLTGLGRLAILLVVASGMLLARAVVRYGIADSDGQNVPDVMLAVAKRGGVVPAVPVALKAAAAALAIGTGGSAGAEGPMAVTGAAVGSRVGRLFRSSPDRLKVLVACGAASGISAAFNAPIAGVFFALEKITGTFGAQAFAPVLVASVIAALVSRAAFGNSPAIAIPEHYGLGSPAELVAYGLLGVATGIVSVAYTKAAHQAGAWLQRLRQGWWAQVLVASLVVGALDLAFRSDLWGRGHQTLSLAIVGHREAWFLVALALAKLVATAVTVSAVRAGGVFTPALFIGATLGGGLALAWQELWPGWHLVPEAFALVGMAGLVAGSTHAPLTGIMIVFEMTNDYELILPLMLCGAVAYLAARRLHPLSIYSEWLARRGESLVHGQDAAVLERLKVRDCYNPRPQVIPEHATVPQIIQVIAATAQTEFPVVNQRQELVGMIAYDDLRAVLTAPEHLAPVLVAGDLASDSFERVSPDDSLRTALRRINRRGSHCLPVVDPQDGRKLLGLISRHDMLSAYDRALLQEG